MEVEAISGLRLAAELWWKAVVSSSVEGGLAILCVYCLCHFLPQLNARVKSWFWRLVFIRVLLAFVWFNPVGLPLLPARVQPVRIVRAEATPKHVEVKPTLSSTELSQIAHVDGMRAAPSEGLSWAMLLMLAWGLGVACQTAFIYLQYYRSRQLRGALYPCPRPRAHELLASMAKRMGVSKVPSLAVASGITSPQLVGFWRPMIILPSTLFPNLATKDLRLILAHELAHVRRRDLAWLWLATSVRILLFFHPLVWLAYREWLMTQEMACDEQVIGDTPSAAGRYSRILLSLAAKPLPRLGGGLSMTDRSSSAFLALRRRLEFIYASRLLPSAVSCRAVIAVAAWGVVLSLPWHLTARANSLLPRPLTGVPFDFTLTGSSDVPAWWESTGDGYEFVTDKTVLYHGLPSGRLSTKIPGYYGTVTQCVGAAGIAGGRVRYNAVLQTRGVTAASMRGGGGAGLWARADDGDGRVLDFANMQDTALLGDRPWTASSVELEVPPEAARLCFGVFLRGHGEVWVNAVSLALTSGDEAAAHEEGLAGSLVPSNLDFEEGVNEDGLPVGWRSQSTREVQLSLDQSEAFSGGSSVRLTASGSEPAHGRLAQCADTAPWRGRRIALTGYLKTNAVTSGRAALWMVVQGADTRPLAFDFMHDQDVVGTTDWHRYQLVLDVPGEAVRVCYGATLKGFGTVWADNFAITDIGPEGGTARTRPAQAAPLNLNFEDGATLSGTPMHWHGGGAGYSINLDREVVHTGHASAAIRSASPEIKDESDFAKLYQCVSAAPYIGHRLRYAGFLKTAGVTHGWAGLWLRVEDEHHGTLAFDNMRDRAPGGTTDWQQFAVDAPVPADAAQVCYGFHLAGPGELWVDDLSFGVTAS